MPNKGEFSIINKDGVEEKVILPEEHADKVGLLVESVLRKQSEEHEKKLKDTVSIEKKKLYDTIEQTKKEKEAAEKKASDFEKAEAERNKALEDKKKAETDSKVLIEQLEQKLKTDAERVQAIIDLKDKEFKAELSRRDLEIYKKEKIFNANGKIIPELVSGNSTEEIDVAVEKAKARYIEIIEGQKQAIEDELMKTGKIPGAGPKDKDKASGASTLAGGDFKSWEELMKMDPKDFLDYQKGALAKLGV